MEAVNDKLAAKKCHGSIISIYNKIMHMVGQSKSELNEFLNGIEAVKSNPRNFREI